MAWSTCDRPQVAASPPANVPERGGQDEQQRRARVAERASSDLAGAERRDDPAATAEDPLADLGQARDEPGREHGAGEQPDRRSRDEQRIDPEDAARVPGQRRAVQAELPQGDHGEDDEGEVDPEPLRQGPADLPAERGPDPGRAGLAEQRRHGQDRRRTERREPRRDERGRGRSPTSPIDPAGASGPIDAEQPDRADRQNGATKSGGTVSMTASPKASATRWPDVAPRERSSAVSVRRRSTSRPATSRTA